MLGGDSLSIWVIPHDFLALLTIEFRTILYLLEHLLHKSHIYITCQYVKSLTMQLKSRVV